MNNFDNFGPIIKRLRKERSMTQEDLCAATGYVLQPGYLSQLERKPYTISFKILNAVCKALNVSIADMVREVDGGEVAEPGAQYITAPETTGTLAEINKLPITSFTVELTSNAMESTEGISYYKGGCVIAVPENNIATGDDVVVDIDGILTPARYMTDGRREFLTYLNKQFPAEPLPEGATIKGKIVGFAYSSKTYS